MCAADLFDPFDRPFFRQNPSGRANILVRKLRDRFHFQAIDYRQVRNLGRLGDGRIPRLPHNCPVGGGSSRGDDSEILSRRTAKIMATPL